MDGQEADRQADRQQWERERQRGREPERVRSMLTKSPCTRDSLTDKTDRDQKRNHGCYRSVCVVVRQCSVRGALSLTYMPTCVYRLQCPNYRCELCATAGLPLRGVVPQLHATCTHTDGGRQAPERKNGGEPSKIPTIWLSVSQPVCVCVVPSVPCVELSLYRSDLTLVL